MGLLLKAVSVTPGMTVVIVPTVVEGLALLDLGVSPYSGDVFHEVKTTGDPVYAAVDLSRPLGNGRPWQGPVSYASSDSREATSVTRKASERAQMGMCVNALSMLAFS